MATSSLKKTVRIEDPETAEWLISLLEKESSQNQVVESFSTKTNTTKNTTHLKKSEKQGVIRK